MCTSIAMRNGGFYFGRNMDVDFAFGQRVAITPRNHPFQFRRMGRMDRHHAIIGMARVEEGCPLYAEASNEAGLCMAGLNFPQNAYYPPPGNSEWAEVSPFELIPWVLGQCGGIREARALLERTCLVDIPFSAALPVAPLHWHIADREGSLVLESTCQGMAIYDDPVGIMTNNPPFPFHLDNLCQYMNLTPEQPSNCFSQKAKLKPFGCGLGSIGLPGDFSPASRFVKAAYLLLNSTPAEDKDQGLSQFFHLLGSVSMVQGGAIGPTGGYELTAYTCCIDAEAGIYYYTTYGNHQITAVHLYHEDLNGREVAEYPLRERQSLYFQN